VSDGFWIGLFNFAGVVFLAWHQRRTLKALAALEAVNKAIAAKVLAETHARSRAEGRGEERQDADPRARARGSRPSDA
jgi:hypothetical protein